jgi:hypothetical protein
LERASLQDATASALQVADRLLDIPRSEWWSESSTHWVTQTTYINNVVGLVDQDTWFCALVEVCDQMPDATWRSWLVVEWDSHRHNPVAAWWMDTGKWRFFDEESSTGESKSTVFTKWANSGPVSSLGY